MGPSWPYRDTYGVHSIFKQTPLLCIIEMTCSAHVITKHGRHLITKYLTFFMTKSSTRSFGKKGQVPKKYHQLLGPRTMLAKLACLYDTRYLHFGAHIGTKLYRQLFVTDMNDIVGQISPRVMRVLVLWIFWLLIYDNKPNFISVIRNDVLLKILPRPHSIILMNPIYTYLQSFI